MNQAQIIALIEETARRYGVDPAAAVRTAQIESKFNPRAQNPESSAGGVFQFIDSTWRQYGGGADKYDPVANIDAGVRLMRDNGQTLQRAGIDPTPGALYLAHQQGAGGATKLLGNPGGRAVDTVGRDAVLLNGGNSDWTNAQFASKWMDRASGDPQRSAPGGMVAAGYEQAPGEYVPGKADQANPTGQEDFLGTLVAQMAAEEEQQVMMERERQAELDRSMAELERRKAKQERRKAEQVTGGIGARQELWKRAGIDPDPEPRFGYGGVRDAGRGYV